MNSSDRGIKKPTYFAYKFLKEISNGAPISRELALIENGIYDKTLIVRENDVFLVKIKKYEKKSIRYFNNMEHALSDYVLCFGYYQHIQESKFV